MTLINVFVERY